MSAIGALVPQMMTAGGDLLRGLASGIGNAVGSVIAKASEVAGQVVGAVKNAFGIHSPSRVFREIGRMLGKGLALGVGDGVPEVKASIAKMSEQASKLAEAAVKDEAKRLVAARRRANADIAKWNKNRGKGVKAKSSLGALSLDDAMKQARKNLPQIKTFTAALQAELKKQSKLTTDLWDDGKYKGAVERWQGLNKGTVALLEGLKANGKARKEAGDAVKGATLVDIGKAHGQIVGALDAAKKTLKELRDASAQLRASVASSLTGELDLKALMPEDGPAPTFETVKAAVSGLLSKVRKFAGLLSDLKDAGIPGGLIQEVASLGTAGIPIAEALKTGSTKQVKDLSNDWISLGKWSDKAGKNVADSMYKVGIDATKGLIKGLESDQAKLVAAASRLADKVVDSAKKSLGIKSPSRVLMAVGGFAVEGLRIAIDGGRKAIGAAAERLAVAAVPDVSFGAQVDDWARARVRASAPVVARASAIPAGTGPDTDAVLGELVLLRAALSSLTVVDSDGALVGRMRVEAQREIGVLGDLVRARR